MLIDCSKCSLDMDRFVRHHDLDERFNEFESQLYCNYFETYDCTNHDCELRDAIDDLKSDLDKLRDEMKRRISEVNIFKTKTIFRYELDNVKQFFDLNKKCHSDFFFASGMPWGLRLSVNEKMDQRSKEINKYLAIFLNNHNNADYTEWSMNCTVRFRLVNPLPNIYKDRSQRFNCIFTKDYPQFGYSHFISYADLKSGFLNENKIKLEIALQCNGVARE